MNRFERSSNNREQAFYEDLNLELRKIKDYDDEVSVLSWQLLDHLGVSEKDCIEINLQKPWGMYLTLSAELGFDEEGKEIKTVQKILGVRPAIIANDMPSKWNESYWAYIKENIDMPDTVQPIGLSLQRHNDNRREKWRVLAGHGHHLSVPAKHEDPFESEPIVTPLEYGTIVTNDIGEWHAGINTDPYNWLLIAEEIQGARDFKESNITRIADLFGRAGTSN